MMERRRTSEVRRNRERLENEWEEGDDSTTEMIIGRH